VIGGGLLGLEAARGLQNFGLEVSVVHLGKHLMPAQLDHSAGDILKMSIEKLGIKVLLGKSTPTLPTRSDQTENAPSRLAAQSCPVALLSNFEMAPGWGAIATVKCFVSIRSVAECGRRASRLRFDRLQVSGNDLPSASNPAPSFAGIALVATVPAIDEALEKRPA